MQIVPEALVSIRGNKIRPPHQTYQYYKGRSKAVIVHRNYEYVYCMYRKSKESTYKAVVNSSNLLDARLTKKSIVEYTSNKLKSELLYQLPFTTA